MDCHGLRPRHDGILVFGLAMTDCDFCSTPLRRYGLYGLGDFFSIRLGLHGFEVLQNTLPMAPNQMVSCAWHKMNRYAA